MNIHIVPEAECKIKLKQNYLKCVLNVYKYSNFDFEINFIQKSMNKLEI